MAEDNGLSSCTIGSIEKQRITWPKFRLHGVTAGTGSRTTLGDRATEFARVDEIVYPPGHHDSLVQPIPACSSLRQQRCLEVASRSRHVGVVDETRRTYRRHGRQRDAPRRIATFRHATLRVAPHRYATLEPLGKPGGSRAFGGEFHLEGTDDPNNRGRTRR